jgi:hypothetical protein
MVNAENTNKTGPNRHHRFFGLRLWTTLSGFESLPPSHITFHNYDGLRRSKIETDRLFLAHVIGLGIVWPQPIENQLVRRYHDRSAENSVRHE